MPKRTNDYQRLVEMIHRAFAPKGAKITESAPIPGRERFREIDVLFEGHLGLFSLRIAIEATKTKRKLDAPAIEKFIGKYLGADVDKVVIVAQGFTPEAMTRAREARIQLWTLVEAQQSDWTRLSPTKLELHFPPHVCKIEVTPAIPAATERRSIATARIICQCCGRDKGSVGEFAQRVLRTQVMPNPQIIEMMNRLIDENAGVARFKLSSTFSGHQLRFEGENQPFTSIDVHIHYIRGSGDAIWSTYRFGNGSEEKCVDQMEVKVGGKHVRVVFPSGPKSPQIVLRLDDDTQHVSARQGVTSKVLPSSMTFKALPWNVAW